mmetsp:Transcript_21917/g.55803  ORF Transcript_21917/g.55803 Transcript_21917/m.55803 type:complete len:283 (-) Transcript_21917:288-1136(-)
MFGWCTWRSTRSSSKTSLMLVLGPPEANVLTATGAEQKVPTTTSPNPPRPKTRLWKTSSSSCSISQCSFTPRFMSSCVASSLSVPRTLKRRPVSVVSCPELTVLTTEGVAPDGIMLLVEAVLCRPDCATTFSNSNSACARRLLSSATMVKSFLSLSSAERRPRFAAATRPAKLRMTALRSAVNAAPGLSKHPPVNITTKRTSVQSMTYQRMGRAKCTPVTKASRTRAVGAGAPPWLSMTTHTSRSAMRELSTATKASQARNPTRSSMAGRHSSTGITRPTTT